VFGTGDPGASGPKSFSDQEVVDFLKEVVDFLELLDEDKKDRKGKNKTAAGSSSDQEVADFLKLLDEDLKDRKDKDKDKAATGTPRGHRSTTSTGCGTAPAAAEPKPKGKRIKKR